MRVLNLLVLLCAATIGFLQPVQAQENGWTSLSRAYKLLTPLVRKTDDQGEWQFLRDSELQQIRAVNARNQGALVWLRRGLRQSLAGPSHGFNTLKSPVPKQLGQLGYALINDGRVKLGRGEIAAAYSAFEDAIRLANATDKATTSPNHIELFHTLSRMAGVARLEMFYSARYLGNSEWNALYARWHRLSQQQPALPQATNQLQRDTLQLAMRCLLLENEAVDMALWLRKFQLKNQRKPLTPEELRTVGWTELAMDPFASGERLRWKQVTAPGEEDRILIYSAGPNGHFDGGAQIKNPEREAIFYESPVIEMVKKTARGDLEVLRFRLNTNQEPEGQPRKTPERKIPERTPGVSIAFQAQNSGRYV